MGEEPAWPELLLAFAFVAAIPVVVGGALFFSLFGPTMWATAPLRRRRRARRTGSTKTPPPENPEGV